MPSVRTLSYGDYDALLDTMEITTSAIKAFASMLEISLHSGNSLKEDADGIFLLLNQQCDDLRFLEKAFREEFAQIRMSKLEVKNVDKIAEWAGVSQYVVNNVIYIATGIYLGPPVAPKKEGGHATA